MATPNIVNTSFKAPQLAKATLIACNNEAPDIVLMFNPEEITFTRTVKWEPAKGNHSTTLLPKTNFSAVEAYKFTLKQLIFDTYEAKTSVMEKIDPIRKGVEMVEGLAEKRPPVYIFTWGYNEKNQRNEYFYCVINSLTYKLNMFLTDGTPVRAIVDISLQEVDKSTAPGSKESSSQESERSNPNAKTLPGALPVPPKKKP